MNLFLTIGICIVLLAVFVKVVNFFLEQLSKFLLVLRFPNGPISLFFQILGLGVPFAVLSIMFVKNNAATQLVTGTAVGYAIFALLGIPALLGLRHKGTIRTVISSQSLASVLFGGFAFILAGIDQQISSLEGAVLLFLCIAYLSTGFSLQTSQPLPHRTELSIGRILGLILVIVAVIACTYYTSKFAIDTTTQFPDNAVLGLTLIAAIFVIPLFVFAWKNAQHTQTVIQTAAHNAVMILLGWVGLFAIFTPLAISPYVLVLGLLFLFIAIFCFFLIGREVIVLNRFTAIALICLLLLYIIKLFFNS